MTPSKRKKNHRIIDPSLPKGTLLIDHLGKAYRHYTSPAQWLKEKIFRRTQGENFWALQDISFTLSAGETLGIIGQNGAGKSTLLQLIAGTLTPSSGTIRYNGRISALLELGAGFHPEFTGRENVRLSANLMGLHPAEIETKLPDILEFAAIGDAIDRPVKTYSSGMFVRLAFAVATAVEPDILIIDEALAVGDGAFARKSFDRIMRLKEQGTTLLFCSHALYQVRELCQRALWINHGTIAAIGPATTVVEQYQTWLEQHEPQRTPQTTPLSFTPQPYSEHTPKIKNLSLTIDGKPAETTIAESGKSCLSLTITVKLTPNLPPPRIGCLLHTADGRNLASFASWDQLEITPPNQACDLQNERTITLCIPSLPLLSGRYSFSVFLLCERGIHIYDQATWVMPFTVSSEQNRLGYVIIPHQWQP